MKKLICFLCMIFVSLFMVNSSLAQPVPLVPLKVGYTNAMFEIEWDSGNCINNPNECWWVKHLWQLNMVKGKTTIGGVEYFQEIQVKIGMENNYEWNVDLPLKRSTGDTLYWRTPSGNEYAAFTIANGGKGNFIPLQELNSGGDGYLYIECNNYNAPADNVTLEWPEDSNEGWPDGNGEWPEGDFENTFDDVYYFKMYNCDYNSTSTCTSYLNDEYEVYWISKGTGVIKFLGGYNENGESPLGGVELSYLKFRKPPVIDYVGIYQREEEGGSSYKKISFGLRYHWLLSPFPGEITQSVPLEGFLTHPDSTIELYHDGNLIPMNNSLVGFYRGGDFTFDHSTNYLYVSDEFKNEFEFSAEAYGLSEGTYNLVVTDGDGIVYEGENYFTPPVDTLPIISADTFQTNYVDGELTWSWTLPLEDDFTYVSGGPYKRLYIGAYQGESEIGTYSVKYQKDSNEIIMPVDNFPSECNRLRLRAQVRLNDGSLKTFSNPIFVPLVDSDGDGISDDLEENLNEVSFIETEYQPRPIATSGEITNGADQVISITDAASSDEGVLLSAYNGDGTATVSICGGSTAVTLTDGDETVVTCGSAIVKALNGEVAVDFFEDGVLVATATLTGELTTGAENTITFEPDTGTFSVPGSNSTPVEAQFFNETGEPIASVELVGDETNENDNSIIFEQETGIFSVPETNTTPVEVVLDDGSEISLDPGDDFMSVDINIRPFSRRNTIVLWDWGYIPVAILSNPDFYAPIDVEKTSITFGQTGDEDSLVFCRNRARDVNGDGMKDLTCLFRTRDTGFEVGDTVGILKCDKTDLTKIQASDSVRIFGR